MYSYPVSSFCLSPHLLSHLYTCTCFSPVSKEPSVIIYTYVMNTKISECWPAYDKLVYENKLEYECWSRAAQYSKCSKIPNKNSRKTGQTQIRLLLKKHPDQGLPCLLF